MVSVSNHEVRATGWKMFETIAELADPSAARVLILTLKAHGFHPLEGGDGGLPGFPGVFGPKGIPIQVPEEEAADARLLADSVIRDMRQTGPDEPDEP